MCKKVPLYAKKPKIYRFGCGVCTAQDRWRRVDDLYVVREGMAVGFSFVMGLKT